ncbi:MAG TPA: hypothetical protein VMH81_37760 [Bryobacteraceae bacterium]|nr:hypothetical protein [Bryobacteraceae bacterium]
MKSRVPIDFLLMVFVYLICAGLIYGAVTMNWPSQLGVQVGNVEDFLDRFLMWSEVAGGISIFCAFAWYVLGEWGPRANQLSSGAWLAIWFALFLAVILGAVAAVFLGPEATENAWVVAVCYVIWGPAFYYLATVLFSPVNTKYIVPGSGLIRRGW